MIDALFSQTGYVATKKMLDATALRQEAIASNLANLETPGYRRIDVNPNFQAELGRATASQDAAGIASIRPALVVDQSAIPNTRDGNCVQLESELLNLNQNTLAHAVETQLVSSSLLKLRMAITGRS